MTSGGFTLSPNAERWLGVCEALRRAAADAVDARMGEREYSWKQLAVTAMYVRSSATYESVLLLGRAGRGVQAAMLTRSLFEDMVDAHWVSIEPDLAEGLFREYAHYFVTKRREASARHPWVFAQPLAVDWPELEPDDAKRIRGRLRDGAGSWTGLPLYRRVQAIERLWHSEQDRLHLRFFADWVHGYNNALLHSGPTALAPVFKETEESRWVFDPRPSEFYLRQALNTSLWTYGQTVTLVMDELGLPAKKELVEEALVPGVRAFENQSEVPSVSE